MEYKKQKPGKKSPYSDSFRRMVVEEVLSGKIFIAAAAKKHGITHRSTVSSWIRWYRNNYDIVIPNATPVAEEDKPKSAKEQTRIKELEAALELAKLKIIGLETLIDVAEEQLKIDIRKKPGTKQ
jgi:transposase